MATRFLAFLLCQRRVDEAFLCVRQKPRSQQFSFFSVEADQEDVIPDTLQRQAVALLHLQFFRRELTLPSDPINGSGVPAVVVCKACIKLDLRMTALIARSARMATDFFSSEEIKKMAASGKFDSQAHEVLELFA